jgi:flagellar protein FliT
VLADDAEIRKFTEPWMTRLAVYLGNARQEYQLRRAYESDSGS